MADENKRRQLEAILHDQHQKIVDRQDKINKMDCGVIAGQLQRFVLHNQRGELQQQRVVAEVQGIKLRSTAQFPWLLSKSAGVALPTCIRK